MTDTLRTKIAAAIYTELREQSDRDTAFPVMVGPAVGSPNFNGVALIDGEVDLDAAADAVIRELPEPIKPTPPELEDLTSIPAQKHAWGREWDADVHQGYFCTECEEMSDCEMCKKDWDAGDDCLVVQADNRNLKAMRLYEKILERWEAQMDYWREMTGAADD